MRNPELAGRLRLGIRGELGDYEIRPVCAVHQLDVRVLVCERDGLYSSRKRQCSNARDESVRPHLKHARTIVKIDGNRVDKRVRLGRGQRIAVRLFEQ